MEDNVRFLLYHRYNQLKTFNFIVDLSSLVDRTILYILLATISVCWSFFLRFSFQSIFRVFQNRNIVWSQRMQQ